MSQTLVTVKSAIKPDADSLSQIAAFAKKKLGREVKLEVVLDKDVIAGFVIEIAGLEYDYSLRGSLSRLAKTL